LRVLLDTHVMLWTLYQKEALGKQAVEVLAAAETQRVVSVVSLWEVAIKRRIGRLDAPDDLPSFLGDHRHEILPVNADHAWRVGELPLIHSDPFDRLLVAQAQIEGVPLITHDRALERYDIRVIRA
jgi:PIN domain nuclease of toxin-antitoxin system